MSKRNSYYRFIIQNEVLGDQDILKKNKKFTLNGNNSGLLHQLIKVLRVKQGDQIVLIPENKISRKNTEYLFEVNFANKKEIFMKMQNFKNIEDNLKFDLGLVLALPNKIAKLEEILMHCTELGTTHFILFKGDYSNFSHKANIERWEKIIKEAAEQSERARIPTITIYKNLDLYLKNRKHNICIAALERAENQKNPLNMEINTSCDILIGPEGGFSDREVELIKSHKIETFTLGKQILRTQTAAIVSTGIISLKMQS